MEPSALQEPIVRIHEGIFTLPFDHFRELALEEVRAVIPFDMAVWGSGIHSLNQILSVSIVGLPEASLLTYAALWQEQDFVRLACARLPGKAFRNEDVMPLDQYHCSAIYREYSHPAGIEHALGIIELNSAADIADMIFLFRNNPEAAFTEGEREALEALSPHLRAAWSHAQIAFHYRAVAEGFSAGDTKPESYAVADKSGLLFAIGENFSDSLRSIDPDWTGPHLPAWLSICPSEAGTPLLRKSFEFSVQATKDRLLLAVSPETTKLGLTPTEYRVARLYAGGQTQQSIAQSQGVSVSTVRNQLASAYRKLSVHSKVELARILQR